MNSYQTIINELIKQKQILDEKGFAVDVANNNPAPSEITTALGKINFDFTVANATEADVFEGKTFFAQNNELKVGTFSGDVITQLELVIRAMISGDLPCQVNIPEYCSKIRPYAFYNFRPTKYTSMFAQDDLIIPNHVLEIGDYAFYNLLVKNKVSIPAGCVVFYAAFQNSTMTEIEFAGTLDTNASYAFTGCKNVKKITILEPTPKLTSYCFNGNVAAEEIHLAGSLINIANYCFNNDKAVKFVKFYGTVPPTIGDKVFEPFPTAKILVPYTGFISYYYATNYQKYNNPIIGYGEFNQGDYLPSTLDLEPVTWHTSSDDAVERINPVTICPETGTMYAIHVPEED